jgi:hypothetical protein
METAMVANSFLGFILPFLIFIITNVVLAYNSYRLTQTFFYSDRTSERCMTIFLLMIAQIILFETMAGLLTLLTFSVIVAEVVVAFILIFLVTRPKTKSQSESSFAEELGLYLHNLSELATSSVWAKFATGFFGFFCLSFLVLNAQTPPFHDDIVNYHFPLVSAIYQTHSLLYYHTMTPNELFYYPFNGVLFALWGMLPLGSDFLARYFQAPFGFLIILTFYALLRKLGVEGKRAYLFSFLPLAFPWIMMRSLLNRGVDEVFTYAIIALAYYLLVYHERPRYSSLMLVGISAGLFLGSKYLAMPFGAGFILAGLYLFLTLRAKNRVSPVQKTRVPGLVVTIFIVAGGALIWGGFVYIRNWIAEGSPLFPFSIPIIGQLEATEAQPAQIPQLFYRIRDWWQGASPPKFMILILSASVLLAAASIFKKAWRDQDPTPRRALAWCVLGMVAVYSVYPLMSHSRYILGILFIALAVGLSAWEGSSWLSRKSFGVVYVLGCCVLFLLNFRYPTFQFYEFYPSTMLFKSLIGGALIFSLIMIFRLRFFWRCWERLPVAMRLCGFLLILILVGLTLNFRPFRLYPDERTEYYNQYFHPIYGWLEQHSRSAGKHILNLDLITDNYLINGSRLQNQLYRLSSYDDNPYCETGFKEYVRQHRIDWILYRPFKVKNRRDIFAVKKGYHDSRELDFTGSYYPPVIDWMRDDPQNFKLISQIEDACIYQVLPNVLADKK